MQSLAAKLILIVECSHLLTHTSGFPSPEEEEIMEYYQALGDPKGTLLMRYFMTDDKEVRAKALPEVQHMMNSLVITLLSSSKKGCCYQLTILGIRAAPLRAWYRMDLRPGYRLGRTAGMLHPMFHSIYLTNCLRSRD